MRYLSTVVLCLFLPFASRAQQKLSPEMERAVAVCIDLSSAMEGQNIEKFKTANRRFKAAAISHFNDLRLEKGKVLGLKGHFVFDEVFVDSLTKGGRRFLEFADRYDRNRSLRSSTVAGRVKLCTKALEAGKSAVWKTRNSAKAEYALVAEPLGLFTVTVRDQKGRVLYAETYQNKKGSEVRRIKMKLPNVVTVLLIEIKNCGTRDASFALIGN